MLDFSRKVKYNLEDLISLVAMLRGPGGCPWDKKQTHHTLRANFIEETYEAIEAIDSDNVSLLREELGDVLLQVVLHSQIESEVESFDMSDVITDICNKILDRHPHVFDTDKVADSEQDALRSWERMKREKKGYDTVSQSLESVSKSLPSTMRAEKVQQRAAGAGFCYADALDALADLESEICELREAILQNASQSDKMGEVGDIIFSAVNVSRKLDIDAEQALYISTDKFIDRFRFVEHASIEMGIPISELRDSDKDKLWKQSKKLFAGNDL